MSHFLVFVLIPCDQEQILAYIHGVMAPFERESASTTGHPSASEWDYWLIGGPGSSAVCRQGRGRLNNESSLITETEGCIDIELVLRFLIHVAIAAHLVHEVRN